MTLILIALLALAVLLLIGWRRQLLLRRRCERHMESQQQRIDQTGQQLRQQLDQAGLDNLALTQYLLNYSEQLRGPLQTLIDSERWLDNPSSEIERGMRQLRLSQAIDEMQSLIEHALALSVKQAGETTLHHQQVNLHDLLLKVRKSQHNPYAQKALSLSVKLASNVPEHVVLDAQRLMQVILNLVSHIAEDNSSGKVEIMLKQLTRENNIARVLFSVADVSYGQSRMQQSLHFTQQDFETQEITNQDADSPGLAISQRLVTLMGGQLRLERHKKIGQRYYFSIPIKLLELELEQDSGGGNGGTKLPITQPKTYPLKSVILLLLTADQQQRLYFSSMLTGQGATVDSVENGKLAIRSLLHGQRLYDALIIDLERSAVNGLETLVEIRDVLQLQNLPMIGIVNQKNVKLQAQADEAGVNAYLFESMPDETVIDCLAKLLAD